MTFTTCVTTVFGTTYTGRGARRIRRFAGFAAGLCAGFRACRRTVTCRLGVVIPTAAVGSVVTDGNCGAMSTRSVPAIGSSAVLVATKTTPAGARRSGTHSKRTAGTVTPNSDAEIACYTEETTMRFFPARFAS